MAILSPQSMGNIFLVLLMLPCLLFSVKGIVDDSVVCTFLLAFRL